MHAYLNTAVKAARRAGDIIVRGLNRIDTLESSSKGHNDFVTSIDHAAEAAIIDTLRNAYPSHGYLAEESGATKGDADITWIIDPLDGTTNYMHGYRSSRYRSAARSRVAWNTASSTTRCGRRSSPLRAAMAPISRTAGCA
jgi:myo-inositol-1(or 4)-monophosphatase